jgi:hypothetical protein
VRFRRKDNRSNILFLLDRAWPTKRCAHQPIQDNKNPVRDKLSRKVQSRKTALRRTRTCGAIAPLRPGPCCYTPFCGAFQHPEQAVGQRRPSSSTTEVPSTPARTNTRAARMTRVDQPIFSTYTRGQKMMTHHIHLHVIEQWGPHQALAEPLDLTKPFPARGVPCGRALEQHARIIGIA